MRIGIGATTVLVAAGMLLAGCGSDGNNSTATPPPSKPTTVTAVVNATFDNSQCDIRSRPGDCWLPLYVTPAYISRTDVINLRDEDGSPCRIPDEVNGLPANSQEGCWPQHGTLIDIACQVTNPGGTWYAIVIPPGRQLWNENLSQTARAAGLPHPWGDGSAVLGFNQDRYVTLTGKTPDPCKFS